ncbi:ATPase family AAA domain-containing protein 5 [Papilio machaon]|uniref:ATPase family AAA domain-containing protein 5 n=1 Tax=Papilio machaon TaxID=76193 RepID=A0A194QNQ0_PAPMA|nr:ATPase family AAA domain-containing protein 5 [Papilio machaon]
MSICLDTVFIKEIKRQAEPFKNNIKHKNRTVLRCRNNILKPKCDRTLKRKLKKYKLRKDGEEDQDIIDVSQTFVTSLIIKSPNTEMSTAASLKRNLKPSRVEQSFTMHRRKKNIKPEEVDPKTVSPTQSLESNNQTDAFKVLMDSRNKVIGSNSPGKERILDESELQEVTERKELKVRRTLSLKKMAQAKGALQKQERDESREKYVKNEMAKRAERLRNMIAKPDAHSSKNINNKSLLEPQVDSLNQTSPKTENGVSKKSESLKISKSFSNTNLSDSSLKHNITKEEVEFLKKLSPSIRKKENMLCYFNVVTKEIECESVLNENDSVDEQAIIKVKITSKSKKKKKQEKNIAQIHTPVLIVKSHDNDTQHDKLSSKDIEAKEVVSDRKKRKRKKHVTESESTNFSEVTSTDSRPKRNIKKPIKYEDALVSSSDEEFHIFTPKKKKGSVNNVEQPKITNNVHTIEVKNSISNKCIKQYPNKASTKKNIPSTNLPVKKPLKLAPIFAPKPQLTAEELKAKQEFLHSGIPNHVKKNNKQPVTCTTNSNCFLPVVHIQQIDPNHVTNSTILPLSLLHSDDEPPITNSSSDSYKNLLTINTENENLNVLDFKNNVKTLLKAMKNLYSKFPVYRTYHSLKAKSRGEIGETQCIYLDNSVEIINGITDTCNDNLDKLKWTDKYKATSTKQIIGNFESIKELRKWLISWTENCVPEQKDSDSSDFCYSDTDSGDVKRMRNNLLILTGKTGSGKTSSVYAVASELSIKVIEVNASSKRTGKIMLQDLQEATQSHKVNRQMDGIDNSQKSIDVDSNISQNKKRGRPKKQTLENLSQKSVSSKKDSNSEPFSSQESMRTVMSLILIDDADIIFEQDDGFCSAIAQLVHSSKRPVILITESVNCPHLQKFLKYSQVISLQPFLPRMLGTWLDIMCLADSSICYPGLGAKLLDFFKGDIRKTINCLQFYMTSHRHILKRENASQGYDFIDAGDDEASSMSWAVNEEVEDRFASSTAICNSSIQYFLDKQINIHNPSPFLTFNVWWSLPAFLNFNCNDLVTVHTKENEKIGNDVLKLETISSAIDTLSVLDLFENTTAELRANITSKPWFSPESASLIEGENFEYYDRTYEITQDISQFLMTSSIQNAQRILKCEQRIDVEFPSMTMQRERDKIIHRHKSLTHYLNPVAVLDRKAVALDYWSSCRSICRSEKTKTDLSSKRNNRFCHYLKSLNILCNNEYFDKLGDSLCLGENL